jgi:hypothetical protein
VDHLAGHLHNAAAALTGIERALREAADAPAAFAADTAGLPGRLGRSLHARWSAELTDHAEEAADLATRLTDTAQAVRASLSRYAETDDLVRRRLDRRA